MSRFHAIPLVVLCLSPVIVLSPAIVAWADPLPTILTFEMKKQHDEKLVETRAPKTFWARQIVRRIEDKRPPRTAMPAGQAVVHFVVGRDGAIVSSVVARSSGRSDLDRLALEMVDRAAPFPPMPPGLSDDTVAFDLPLRFR